MEEYKSCHRACSYNYKLAMNSQIDDEYKAAANAIVANSAQENAGVVRPERPSREAFLAEYLKRATKESEPTSKDFLNAVVDYVPLSVLKKTIKMSH